MPPPRDEHDPLSWHLPEGHSGYTWNELLTMSDMLAKSSMVPAIYRRAPANIVMVAIIGQELGWGLATAMRFVHIIDGKPTVSPEAMLALVRRAGHSVDGESDHSHATITGIRCDNNDSMTVTFDERDARAAKLLHKDNWQNYPQAMYWARALAMLCRRLFPDVLLGAAYTPDEMGAVTNERGEPIETTAVESEPEEPDYHALGWFDANHVDAARRLSKTLLDQFTEEDKTLIRRTSGPVPPKSQYSHSVWSARHKILVAAGQKIGLTSAFDEIPVELAEFDPDANQDTPAAVGDAPADTQVDPAEPVGAPTQLEPDDPDAVKAWVRSTLDAERAQHPVVVGADGVIEVTGAEAEPEPTDALDDDDGMDDDERAAEREDLFSTPVDPDQDPG